MKIWLPTIATGTGAEVYARQLAAGLAERGHDVHLDLLPHRFQYAPWLANLRLRPDADVTLANSWSGTAFAGPAPFVTVVHHVVHDPSLSPHKSLAQRVFHSGFVRPMERRAIAAARAVIAVSETTARAVQDHLSDVPVELVLNGVNTDFFRPPPERKLHDSSAPLELLFVGKPSRRKGFDLIAEIVQRLGEAVRLTCVGGAPERGLPKPSGRYLGRVSCEALRQAYQEADLLLFPSRLEGFGYAAAEALSCGLPVVCAEGGAVAEIAPTPSCGLACRPDDAACFAAAILALGRDPATLHSMRHQARAHAVEYLGHRRWIKEIEAVLQRAAK